MQVVRLDFSSVDHVLWINIVWSSLLFECSFHHLITPLFSTQGRDEKIGIGEVR